MADGPVGNLPLGFDAYAGYVDQSGIGVTFPAVALAHPTARLLSISVHGNPAQCADVEQNAMTDWRGYPVGYCAVSNAMAFIAAYGRPQKLWTAHYTGVAHICGPDTCKYPGLTISADGTQWWSSTYDESLLSDNFFDFQGADMSLTVSSDGCTIAGVSPQGHLLVFTADATLPVGERWQPVGKPSVADVTAVVGSNFTLAT